VDQILRRLLGALPKPFLSSHAIRHALWAIVFIPLHVLAGFRLCLVTYLLRAITD
jgi:membrane-associated PAP2 superfamily phosphatase